MHRHRPGIRLFVRNRARYNPETENERDLLYVDVDDYANTHIWQIKEVRAVQFHLLKTNYTDHKQVEAQLKCPGAG